MSYDGRHYAYTEPAADRTKAPKIHVVDVASGADHAFETPSETWFIAYEVLDYAVEGIYLDQAYESPRIGLFLLNPSTGAMTNVANLPYILGAAGNKIFWVGSINPADANPIGSLYEWADQLDRFNLADGTRVTWLYRPGKGVSLSGQDIAGHPIAFVQNSTSEDLAAQLILVLDPITQQTILTAPADFIGSMSSIADSHGVWFGGPQGIYLYSEAHGFQKISNQPGYPANGCF